MSKTITDVRGPACPEPLIAFTEAAKKRMPLKQKEAKPGACLVLYLLYMLFFWELVVSLKTHKQE